MICNKKLLAIIPARGGSKRLPRKNILDLSGKPLIAWTIESALNSKYIDRVIVSTDNKEIATISKKYGADIPFMRPNNLATDESTSIDVVLHAVNYFEKVGEHYDYIILLQPTSPLRTVQNIDESIELLQEKKVDAVISVCKAEHHPLWCNTIPSDGYLSNFLDKSILNKRSQDLDKYYRLNGSIYLCNIDRLKNEKTFFLKNNCIAYKMKPEQSIDIDDKDDFISAIGHINYKILQGI
jgi:CMP-N,N'-diacetyllegionaminic acid synthase